MSHVDCSLLEIRTFSVRIDKMETIKSSVWLKTSRQAHPFTVQALRPTEMLMLGKADFEEVGLFGCRKVIA